MRVRTTRQLQPASIWNLHAWQLAWDGNSVFDPVGVANAALVDFDFPAVPDVRWLTFKSSLQFQRDQHQYLGAGRL